MHVFTKSVAAYADVFVVTAAFIPSSTVDVALAAAATLVAVAFALATLDRWGRRRKPQDAAWTVALLLFAVATLALWYGLAHGWDEGSFRVFYLAGAVLNVPWLGLGEVYLLWGRRVGDITRTVLIGVSGFAVGVILVAPIKGTIPVDEIPEGREHFGAGPRILAAVGSGVPALLLIGGAIWTVWGYLRARSRGDRSIPGVRVWGIVLIAVGTIALSLSGTLAARLGKDRAFIVTTLAGVTILFAGFLMSSAPIRRSARPVASTELAA